MDTETLEVRDGDTVTPRLDRREAELLALSDDDTDGLFTCDATVTKTSGDSRTFSFVCSTDAIDSHGDCVEQDWVLDRYQANPVCFLSHDQRDLPIGTASNVRVAGGKLQADITIVPDDCHPKAAFVAAQLKAKTLRACSVGFRPMSMRYEKRDDREVCVLSRNVLYEISVCGLPSNAETLMKRLRTRAVAATAAEAASTERGGARAAMPSEARMSDNKKTGVELVAAAARLGIVAQDEDSAASAILARAESIGDVCKALKLPALASVRDVLEAVSALSAKSAELTEAQAELETLRADKADRDAAECKAHVDAVIAAKPALADAREALEAFAKADFASFVKKHPKPTAPARERVLTERVVPNGGHSREPSVVLTAAVEKSPGQLHSDAAAALADDLAAKFPQKYAGAEGYLAALLDASRSLKAGG